MHTVHKLDNGLTKVFGSVPLSFQRVFSFNGLVCLSKMIGVIFANYKLNLSTISIAWVNEFHVIIFFRFSKINAQFSFEEFNVFAII